MGQKPSFARHFRKGYYLEIHRQQAFPTPYECFEHFVAGPSVPCTVQYGTNVGWEKKKTNTRKTSRPRQSGHAPWYVQYSSYHRNLHLHNSASCPSASKATSSLNTPQDPSQKRNTLLEVLCTITSSHQSLPTPTGYAQAVKLNQPHQPMSMVPWQPQPLHPLLRSNFPYCSQNTILIPSLHQEWTGPSQDSRSNCLDELHGTNCCRNGPYLIQWTLP